MLFRSDEGAQVQLAHHGLEAVQAVAAAHAAFDAVLMDLQMPVMDGFTATARIRHDLGRADLPIVAMTANALAGDREACLAAGMNDHVGKPFDLDHLVAVLRRVAGREDAPAATRGVLASGSADSLPAAVLAAAVAAGVDVAPAVARLGGKAGVYRRMLARFVTDLASWPAQLQTDMAQGGHAAAARQLHTLKGVAATLGASALAALAGQAELQVSAGASASESRLAIAGVVDAINAVAPGLRALLRALQPHDAPANANSTVAASVVVADPAALRDGLQTLARLLRNSDMAALEALAGLQQQHPHPQAFGGRLVKLEELVAGLDFVPALACCDELLAALPA